MITRSLTLSISKLSSYVMAMSPRPRTFSGSASSHIQQRITNDDDEKIVEVDGFTLDCDHIPDRLPYDESSMPSEKDIVRTVFEIPKPRRLTPRNATITMLGSANAGKSTLMNLLIRNKVSAISPKRNTTRSNIMGVYSKGLTQLVFIDTPGIVPATESKLYYREMVTDAWNSVQEADIALLLIDAAKKITPVEEYLIKELASLDKPSNFKLSLVLNKVDLVHPKNRLLPLADQLNKRIDFDKTFMVSARNDDGVSDIKSYLIDNCQEGAWRYSSDTVTDLSLTERINEIVREQLFCRLNQEIPYQISLRNDGIWRNVDGSIRVDQVLYVPNARLKQMVIGKGGDVIDWVKERTARDLSSLLGCRPDLRIEVLVKSQRAVDKIKGVDGQF